MAERVGEIEVYASLEDRDLIAGLRRAEAEFERTRAKIAGSKAEADISADIDPLKRKLKEATADLKKFEKAAAKAKVAGDDKEARKALATQQKLVSELRTEHDARVATLKTQKAANAEAQRAAALTEAQRKLDAARANALEQQERRRAAAAKRAEAEAAKAAAAQARRDAAAARAAQQAAKEAERAAEKRRRADAAAERSAEKQARLSERNARMEARNAERRIRDEQRLAVAAERAAIARQKAEERAHYEATVGAAKQRQQIIGLQREYAKLTDAAERAAKRRAFTVEGRAKLEIDQADIAAKMEAVKAQLNYMGEHPPVEIHVEMERRQSMSRMRRAAAQFGDIFRTIAEKASNLSTLAIRIGPFTGTIKQFAIALGFVGPLLVDLAGAASALIGVVGSGLAGAMTVGAAGVTGLGLAFGGIKMSVGSAAEEFKLAKQATDAYEKAVAKHGKTSKEAKNAQEQMNRVLAGVGPLAAAAAKGGSEFRAGWEKATGPTRKAMTSITQGFWGAMKDVTPMWSKSTNELSGILDKNLKGGFKFLKSGEFKDNFKAITGNFNDSVPSMMHALGNLGRAFLNFGREGSKFLEPMMDSFDKATGKLLDFTQRDDFGATVKRWAGHAADLGRFFAALGRVVMHFFGAGADAGGKFIVSMTEALNRWDKFLTSDRGRNQVADGMERAVAGTKALWNALAPIAGAFIVWANNFSPFVAGLLQGVGVVMQLLSAVTELLALGGPLAALGMTLGAIWAVGKVGAFVSMLARIPAILRSIAAASGTMAAVGAVFNGRLLAGMKGNAGAAGAVAVAGGQAGAAMRAGVVSGGAVAAAQLRAAMMAGGAGAAAMTAAAGRALSRGPRMIDRAPIGARTPGAIVPGGAARATDAAAKSAGKLATAGNLAKGALAGLGAVALGVPAAVAGVAIAAGAAAFGLYKWSTRTKEWEKNTQTANKSMEAFRNLSGSVRAGYTDLAGASNSAAHSQLGLKSALKQSAAEERNLAAMRAQGKKGTQEYRDALEQHKQTLLGVKDARLQEFASARQRTDLYNSQKKAIQETTKESDKALAAAKRAASDTGLSDALKKFSPQAILDQMKGKGPMFDDQRKALTALIGAQKIANQQDQRAALNMANLKRSMEGLAPMAQSAGRALATVTKLAGKNLTSKISLKFQDPGQAQRVAQSAAKSLQNGVPKTVTSRIVADSRNADQAVRRLQAARLTPKKLQIIESGGRAAIRTLEQIMGRKLTAKEMRIAQRGGEGVLDVLRSIAGKDIPSKRQVITERGSPVVKAAINSVISVANNVRDKKVTLTASDQASGTIRGVISQINSIPSTKSVTIITNAITRSLGKVKARAAGGIGAADGRGSSPPNERQIERAAVTAEMAGARKTRGGKYNQPTLLVGEENRSEVVISTNPKYRKRNLGFLSLAARALGTTVESAAAGSSPFGSFGKGGDFNPKAVLKPSMKFKPTKKKSSKIKSNRSWQGYIEGLETQQGYWEREVSIKESQIQEPENMVVRAPENDRKVVDPNTGESVTVEAFKANPEIESSYKPSLEAVMAAMRTLMSIVVELVRAIPHAILANKQEQSARGSSVNNLNDLIRKDRNRIKSTKGKSREKNERNLDRHISMRDKEKEQIATLKEDEKALNEKRVEAGFDVREVAIAYGDRKQEYDSASGDAARDAAEQNAQANAAAPDAQGNAGGGGGGGGGGPVTPPLSIEAQTAMALQQNAETLRAFGENFISGSNNAVAQFAAGAVAGGGVGGGAMVQNPAAMSGAGASEAMASSRSAATHMTASGAGDGGGTMGAAAPAGPVTNTTVNNTFMAPPPDPHTWSKGVEFELGATV